MNIFYLFSLSSLRCCCLKKYFISSTSAVTATCIKCQVLSVNDNLSSISLSSEVKSGLISISFALLGREKPFASSRKGMSTLIA